MNETQRFLTVQRSMVVAKALLVAVGIVTAAACGGGESGPAQQGKSPGGPGAHRQSGPGENGGRPSLPTLAVAVQEAERGDIATYYGATAALDPDKQTDVLARVNGVVRHLRVEEGDRVRKGRILLEIDDAEYRHRVTQAEVALEQQRVRLGRIEKMRVQGLVAAEEEDIAKSELRAAEAAWELAALELGYTKVESPFDGRVVTRLVDVGHTVSNGTPLYTLADMHRLLARVHVPAREFRNIQSDQPVRLEVDSTGDELTGRIDLVSPVVDPTTGTIKVTVEITDYPASTRPGDFAQVSIVTDRHRDALLVPRIAVLTERGERVVYLADADTAVRRVVDVGFEDDDHAEILSGLEDGDVVVVQGQRSLADGQPLNILDELELGSTTDDAETSDVVANQGA